MKDLSKIVCQCVAELSAIGIFPARRIRWRINTRAKSRWGICKKTGSRDYQIEISERLLHDDVSDVATKNTVIHELLHTIPGGMKHTGNWAAAAAKVNRAYPQYRIQRLTSSEEKGIVPDRSARPSKYALKCTDCGTEVPRERMSKVIRSPQDYRCAFCGGKLVRIR